MKVSIIGSRGYPSTYGGFETLVRRLAPWLVHRGHEVTVYGREQGRRLVRYERIDGVRVVHTPGVERKSLSTSTYGVTSALHAIKDRPDAALVLNVANGPILPILRTASVPTVVNVDGIEWERDKWGGVAKRAFRIGARLTAKFGDRLIGDSREICRIWHDEFNRDLSFVPYGGDILRFDRPSRLLEVDLEPRQYVLVVARLVPENSVGLFLDAMELLGWTPTPVIVGSSNYQNELTERLERERAAGHLIWLGHVSDQTLLGELWHYSSVYFHGHTVGGTNPALLQALGAGARVLAVDTPYNREVLQDEVFLVEPRASEVASRLRAAHESSDVAELADIGRNIVQSRYSWDMVLRGYETELELARGASE